mgnify:CR=1 FL=1
MLVASVRRVDGPLAARGRNVILVAKSDAQRAREYYQRKKAGESAKPGRPRSEHGCGTWQGYTHHRDAGEEACQECKAAWAEYGRKLRQAKTKGAHVEPS